MANLTIPEDVLKEAGLTEQGALLEFACRLFDAGKLTLWSAAKLAGLDRPAMEEALMERQIPVYRVDSKYLAQELAALNHLDRLGR